jgi:hypothetical protein
MLTPSTYSNEVTFVLVLYIAVKNKCMHKPSFPSLCQQGPGWRNGTRLTEDKRVNVLLVIVSISHETQKMHRR